MTRKKKNKTKKPIPETMPDVSRTGDVITNDFDLEASKIPALSTIRQQIKTAKTLVNTNVRAFRTEYDRLKMGVNLIVNGRRIGFEDWGLKDVEKPQVPPSFKKDRGEKIERAQDFNANFRSSDKTDESDIFEIDDNDFIDDEEIEEATAETEEDIDSLIVDLDNVPQLFKSTKIKRQIRYEDYRDLVGLTNLCIHKGYFIIDITGKWMSDSGVLGSIHRDNIREAIEKVRELGIVNFDVDEFLHHAQVFLCDVCVDIPLNDRKQVERYIEGISSYFPLVSNRYDIKKYGRHGLMMKPKAMKAGMSFCIYSKGQELDFSINRSTRATRYTGIIESTGVELAQRTLRLEVKLFRLENIRDTLDIPFDKRGVVRLNEVLNSRTPVMLHIFEKFIGNIETLLNRIEWMSDVLKGNEERSLNDIFIAERFIEIFKENNFDLSRTKSHIKTEYVNVSEALLADFNKLANSRLNVLNFLVYRKPKTITIMLDTLRRLQTHYATGMGVGNG